MGKADKSLFIQELILTTLADSSPASPVTDEPVPQPRMVQQQQLPLKPQPDRPEDAKAIEPAADRQPVPPLIEEKIEVTAVATEAIHLNGVEPLDVDNKNPDPSGSEPEVTLENASDEVILSPSETVREEDRGDDGRLASAIRSKVQSHAPPPIALRSTVHRNVRTSVVREESGSGGGREKPVFETHHTHKRLPGSENRTTGVPTDDRTNRFESSDPTTTMAAAAKKSCMNRRKTSDFKQ